VNVCKNSGGENGSGFDTRWSSEGSGADFARFYGDYRFGSFSPCAHLDGVRDRGLKVSLIVDVGLERFSVALESIARRSG
jgi:hypothetical protein